MDGDSNTCIVSAQQFTCMAMSIQLFSDELKPFDAVGQLLPVWSVL
jgi:hypothetical protein